MPGGFEDLGTLGIAGVGRRRVRAYVPAGPCSGERALLLLFDGQNVFGDAGSFAGGWHAHEAVDKLARVAPIVVAVDHGGLARIDELTPFHDGRRGGKLDALVEAVVGDLLPRVHGRFALGYGPGSHFIGGSSLGGLAALYAHFARPDVFGGALAMSPSLWFTGARFDAFVQSRPTPGRSRIYLDMGAREGRGRMLPLVDGFARQLRLRGWGEPAARGDLRVMMRPDARGRHDERSWRRRLPKALRFLLAA